MGARILTGDRPTGRLHLGHYIGSLANRVALQQNYDQYVMVADMQALTDNMAYSKSIPSYIIEVVKDYLSVGIDPDKTTIFVQSQIPEIASLTCYYLNLVMLHRLERNPTVKAEMLTKGYGSNMPVGFLCYPISQAADITIFRATYVPVGQDQLPMIEQTNEIVRRFNRIYATDFLQECKPMVGQIGRLVGIDGKAKASKSLGNAIMLSDAPDVVKSKVFQMYTDPDHIRVSDPGRVEGNVVFQYLDAFCKDRQQLQDFKDAYRKGGLGDVTLKNFLNQILQDLLGPIREIRATLKDKDVREILDEGTRRAKNEAQANFQQIKKIMGLYS